jgi:hypothetical protein
MGISVRNAGRIHVEDVTDDVTVDSLLYISPQIYRRSENNPLVITFNGKVKSREKLPNKRIPLPGFVVARTDLQLGTANVLEIADTSAIAINVERDSLGGTPYLEFYSAHGGDGRIAIVGDSSKGVMRYQKAIRHQFDSTLVTMKNFGVHTTGPKHEISLYSKTPRLALTNTDANKIMTSVTQAEDTASIVLDVSTATPYLKFYSNQGGDGRIAIVGDSSKGVMRYQRAIRHHFDSTLVAMKNFGVHTIGPRHEISLYSSTPRLGLTDTNVNRVTTSVAQAEDTTSIVLDASTTTPSIITKDNAGRTIFAANSSGNLGIGIGVSPAGRFDVDNDVDGTRDSSFVINTNGGVVVGNPAGGNMGPGTVNAKAVYDDSLQLTDFVFESDYHLASIDSMRAFYERHKHLPTIPGREEWEKGKFAVGNLLNHLWETVEVQARYIAELNERLKKVEALR